MGHKGAGKRKPNISGPFSNNDSNGSSRERHAEHLLITPLVREKGALLHFDGMHPPAGSNKKNVNGVKPILQQTPVSPAAVGLEDQLLSEQLLANDSLGG